MKSANGFNKSASDVHHDRTSFELFYFQSFLLLNKFLSYDLEKSFSSLYNHKKFNKLRNLKFSIALLCEKIKGMLYKIRTSTTIYSFEYFTSKLHVSTKRSNRKSSCNK